MDGNIHKDKSIWIATNQGLSILKDIYQTKPKFTNIKKHHGLVSNNILDCNILDNNLYTLSPQGLSVLNLEDIKNSSFTPRVSIEKIVANKQRVDPDSFYSFNYKQNNIGLHFTGIHYGDRKNLSYTYQLKGYHQNWKTTIANDLLFEKLPPGKYGLELYANINNRKNKTAETFSFEIIPAFYQRTWVRLLALMALLSTLGFVIRFILEREKRKNKIENRLLQLEQVALQSQMNPHFIKNALGAIQHLMIKKDVRTANKYLITFGELITQFLKQADQSLIKINDEINTLELYLSIEKLRFDNNFEYTIHCNAKNLEDHKIPSMMIQPLVENSIIHGFRDLDQTKINQVKISLIPKDAYLICTISDNGLGMAEKNKQRKSIVKKEGIALKNIKERILLLALKHPKTSFKIIRSNSHGTTIELCLPLITTS